MRARRRRQLATDSASWVQAWATIGHCDTRLVSLIISSVGWVPA